MAAAKKPSDAGQAEVQKNVEADQEQGFHGEKVDPLPNSAHSLQSGPDAPTVREQAEAVKKEG